MGVQVRVRIGSSVKSYYSIVGKLYGRRVPISRARRLF